MTDFYDRRCAVRINGETLIDPEPVDGRQMRITFDIENNSQGVQILADIGFYNLTYETSTEVLKKGAVIELDAGYVSTIANIFHGEIINSVRERDGANIVTRVYARSGLGLKLDPIEETLGAGTRIYQVLSVLAQRGLGVPLIAKESDFGGIKPLLKGYTLSGDPRSELKTLATSFSLDYELLPTGLTVWPIAAGRPNSAVVAVSQQSGLVGIPEISEVGLDFKSKLNPQIRPGVEVKIEAAFKTFNFGGVYYRNLDFENIGLGNYRVLKMRIEGDSHGSAWDVSVESIEVGVVSAAAG